MAVLGLASLASAETLTVVVEAQGDRSPDTALLEAYPLGPYDARSTAKLSFNDGRGRSVLELPEAVEGPWRLRVSAEGFWAAETDVSPDLGNLVRTRLWPAGNLLGALRTPSDGQLPGTFEVTLTAAPRGAGEVPQPKKAVTLCAITEDSRFSCRAPSGTWHLRAKVPDYVAQYRWGFRVPADEEVSLGTLQLEPGASLVGRVVTEEGPANPEEARIRLMPLVDRHTASEEEVRKLEQLTSTESLNPWGYFHFRDVAPGSYEIVARQSGFTPAHSGPVSVSRGESVELPKPLVLEVPVRLELAVSPPESPAGHPWGVTFLERDRFGQLEVVEEGRAEAGRWISPPVSPGSYSIRVVDRSGDPIAWHDVELREDRQSLAVDLDLVEVYGEVVLGESPLVSKLWFGGRNGSTRVETTSNEQGEFRVVVPREGAWSVDVSSEEPFVRVEDLEVEIEADGDGKDEVRVELPDTAIRGEVIDPRGSPREGAVVRLLQVDGQPKGTRTRTREDGGFELYGQEPGTWFLEAKAGTAKSEPREVSLVEGSTTGPVRLILKEARRFVGEVHGSAGPVRQAFVLAFPITTDGTLPTVAVPQTRSGIDGSFELDLPANSVSVRLMVLAPGWTLHVERVPLDAEQPTLVQLRQDGGRLVLRESTTEDERVALLLVDGHPLDFLKLSLLRRWAQSNGRPPAEDEVLTLPAMPSGSYAYCRITREEALLVVAGAAVPSTRACTEGFLTPGGELVLDPVDS